VSYVPYPEDIQILQTVHSIFLKVERYPEAITLALKMNDANLVKQDYQACKDP
jgi:26S proteasome regulatory subunit N1